MTARAVEPARCVILGAGGHGRMVLGCLRAAGGVRVVGFTDPDEGLWSKEVAGLPVFGGDDRPRLAGQGVDAFAVGLGDAEGPTARRRLFDVARGVGLAAVAVIHPSALVADDVRLGEGCQIMPRAVINPGVTIGIQALVNTAVILEHDCVVGDHVHVASGAILAGGAVIDDGALVGAGATVIQGVRVGAGAIVGAGAVVIRDVAPDETVVGVPARPIERLWDGGTW